MEHVKDTKEQRKKKRKRVESKHPQKRAVKEITNVIGQKKKNSGHEKERMEEEVKEKKGKREYTPIKSDPNQGGKGEK